MLIDDQIKDAEDNLKQLKALKDAQNELLKQEEFDDKRKIAVFDALYAYCKEQHIDEIVNGEYHEDDDFKAYLYEEIMQTFFGENFFKWKQELLQ